MATKRSHTLTSYADIYAETYDYIDKHFMDHECSLGACALEIKRSRRAIQRALLHWDTSWREMIQERRVNHAKDLLLGTDNSLAMVALECGYKHPAWFTSIFKTWTDLTPAQFRETYKLNEEAKAQ